MIDQKELKKKAERWWPDVLRAEQSQETFFPKYITRIGKVKSSERLRAYERIRQAQDELLKASKNKTGKGYSIHWSEANYQDVGRNAFIDKISFDTLEDYLFYLKKENEYLAYLSNLKAIQNQCPELQAWCLTHPQKIVAYESVWPDLLKVLIYFRDDHQLGSSYIRELPIEVPTKFIESHKAILKSLLDALLPKQQIQQHYQSLQQFEQRFGLKYNEPLIRFRLLDQNIAATYFSGIQDMSISLSDFERLKLPIQHLIILENKTNFSNVMNFLTLPQTHGTMAIFGSGFKVGTLQHCHWMHRTNLFYWGDLDAHGFQILSQLRTYFPHTQAFLMDRVTFDQYPAYHVVAPHSEVQSLAHLSDSELALFHYLNNNQLRLEQERIPLEAVQKALEHII